MGLDHFFPIGPGCTVDAEPRRGRHPDGRAPTAEGRGRVVQVVSSIEKGNVRGPEIPVGNGFGPVGNAVEHVLRVMRPHHAVRRGASLNPSTGRVQVVLPVRLDDGRIVHILSCSGEIARYRNGIRCPFVVLSGRRHRLLTVAAPHSHSEEHDTESQHDGPTPSGGLSVSLDTLHGRSGK